MEPPGRRLYSGSQCASLNPALPQEYREQLQKSINAAKFSDLIVPEFCVDFDFLASQAGELVTDVSSHRTVPRPEYSNDGDNAAMICRDLS
jgi:hypothetical protein